MTQQTYIRKYENIHFTVVQCYLVPCRIPQPYDSVFILEDLTLAFLFLLLIKFISFITPLLMNETQELQLGIKSSEKGDKTRKEGEKTHLKKF